MDAGDAGGQDAGGARGDLGLGDLDAPDDGPSDLGARDAGPGDLGPGGPFSCDPARGVFCDGDFAGRCAASCGPAACCAPRAGAFACLPRDAHGACPAPDLTVDVRRLAESLRVEWRYFPPEDCALVERCVGAPGWRRLLRFDTVVLNVGDADVFLGAPDGELSRLFEFSECHAHYHFERFAAYALLDDRGAPAADGHKQSFCLLDDAPVPGWHHPTDGGAPAAAYTCAHQGLQVGWQDVYASALDCQWVDVTGLAPGAYLLRVALDDADLLRDADRSNDVVTLAVTIPRDDVSADPTAPCAGRGLGALRDCGLQVLGAFDCAPGAVVDVGCSGACGIGGCDGDPVLRVCEGDGPCLARHALALADGAPCDATCPVARLTCPASGRVTALGGPFDTRGAAACDVALAAAARP